MKLLALSIDGFRGIQHAIIRFGEHDVVVGPNGSGKSTIIDALSLVFGLWVANYYSARNPLRLSSLVILGVVARMFRCATRSSCWCT